jgi:hypothetical protein
MVRKFSRPLLHKYKVSSNHTFLCSPKGVLVLKTGVSPQYRCFKSFSEIGGWWFDRPKSFPFKISRHSFENFIALDKFRV